MTGSLLLAASAPPRLRPPCPMHTLSVLLYGHLLRRCHLLSHCPPRSPPTLFSAPPPLHSCAALATQRPFCPRHNHSHSTARSQMLRAAQLLPSGGGTGWVDARALPTSRSKRIRGRSRQRWDPQVLRHCCVDVLLHTALLQQWLAVAVRGHAGCCNWTTAAFDRQPGQSCAGGGQLARVTGAGGARPCLLSHFDTACNHMSLASSRRQGEAPVGDCMSPLPEVQPGLQHLPSYAPFTRPQDIQHTP